jgi:MFS family permease
MPPLPDGSTMQPITLPPPIRARYLLALWLCGLAAILYLDRICLAQALVPIKSELNLTNTAASAVAMAFTLAYGLFAVPTGRLGDRFGPRAVLAGSVVAWSLFTGLTGLTTGLLSLLLVRFLFGATEAGAYPNAAKVMSSWYPVGERGRVQGLMLAAGQIGAVIAPAAASYLIALGGWRWMFGGFALLGFLWAMGFWLWFRDDPARHSAVSPAELAEIRAGAPPPPIDPGPVPWGAVFTNRGILVLGLIMIIGAFYTYFFYTWFQTYLQEARGVGNVVTGWLAALVNAGSAVGMIGGGWVADRIPHWTTDPIRARRYLGVASYLVAAACLFAGIRCDDPLALALLWGAAFCAMHVTLPNWWSIVIPQSGWHVGAVFGLTNGVGVIGAMASQYFVGVFADWQASRGLTGRAQWDPLFDVYVVVLLAGAVAWWLYRFTPLEQAAHPPSSTPDDTEPPAVDEHPTGIVASSSRGMKEP